MTPPTRRIGTIVSFNYDTGSGTILDECGETYWFDHTAFVASQSKSERVVFTPTLVSTECHKVATDIFRVQETKDVY